MGRAKEPDTATFTGFARILGERSPSYVTQLKDAGRLVLTEDGNRIRVTESLALIRETADPARAGVAARHAANRGQGGARVAPAASKAQSEAAVGDETEGDSEALDRVQDSHTGRRAKALADQAELQRRKMEREEQVELGQLLVADDVVQSVRVAAGTLRTTLENLPNKIAPALAATSDEGTIRVMLSEAIEHALEELSRQFSAIGKREAAA